MLDLFTASITFSTSTADIGAHTPYPIPFGYENSPYLNPFIYLPVYAITSGSLLAISSLSRFVSSILHCSYMILGYMPNIPAETKVRLILFSASAFSLLEITVYSQSANSGRRTIISSTYFPVLPYPMIIILSAILHSPPFLNHLAYSD